MNAPSDREAVIFNAARRLPPGERGFYLEGACAGDAGLRQGVEELLRADEAAGGFLQELATGAEEIADTPPPPNLGSTIRVEPSPSEQLGDTIDRYKLLEKIGEGGFGVVYVAEQKEPVKRRVALKIIKLGMDTKQVVARFGAERQALALMDHPNIAKVLDAGTTTTGRPFFVMELVRGIKLTDYCDQHKLSTKERLDLFIQVCRAIQHAHQKGIIHRDIKPSNILVTLHDGVPVPKVIDFGIAKATQGELTDQTVYTQYQQFIGTPAYMSPEQAEMSGLDIDTRSDIYALGVLLYELLTGKTPFDPKELMAAGLDLMRRTIREKEPVRPSTRLSTMVGADLTDVAKQRQTDAPRLVHLVRGDLDWIVMKALEKDRTRRYETANGLMMDIQRHLKSEPVVARPPSNLYRLQKTVRRNRLAFVAASVVGVSLFIGLGISTWSLAKERIARGRALAAERTARTEAERADRHAKEEAVQRERAETAARDAKLTLAASDFSQAMRLIGDDHCGDALAYLARSLSIVPTNEAALNQIASLLTYHSWMTASLSLKHDSWVTSAQFSPDGKRILTASYDGTARVWDARTGERLIEVKHDRELSSAEFSFDGKRIVTASRDSTARVWDAETGMPLTVPLKHGDWVGARFSPDGKKIVTGSRDGTARVWDVESGGLPLTPPLQHQGVVGSARFSPGGNWIVTASFDKTARVWDARTGQAVTGPLQHDATVTSAEFSPDSQRIVTGSVDGTARIWNAQTGEQVTQPLNHASPVLSVRFSPDGKWIVSTSLDGTARVWSAQTGGPRTGALKHGDRVWSAQFSRDGKRIVTASADKTARVWDAQTGRPMGEPLKHSGRVLTAQFSPDGERIITASVDGEARVWFVAGEQAVTIHLRHSDGLGRAQFSPDGRRVVTASFDHTARVWDALTGRPMTKPLWHGSNVVSAEFSFDGKRIVTASADGTARVWDAQSGLPLTDPLQHQAMVFSAHFSPDGNWVVTTSWDNNMARVWDAQTGQPRTGPLKHDDRVASAQFSPDGKRVATASYDKTARVWDAQTGQPVTRPLGHGGLVHTAQFSPDGKWLVTACNDGTAHVWDAQTGELLTRLKHSGDRVTWAQFSPDGKWIVTASLDGTARVWDAQTGGPRTGGLKHGDMVWSAQFSPDGKRIVTASSDHTARVWDAQTGLPLTEPLQHRDAGVSAQFGPDGKWIVTAEGRPTVAPEQTAAKDHAAFVWDVAPVPAVYPDWLAELVEAISGQKVNPQSTLEETKLDCAETLKQIRKRLSREPDDDPWVLWGRWFLSDPATRTISPSSKVTVPEYVRIQIEERTSEALDEAERLAYGDKDLLERISEKRSVLEQTNQPAADGSTPKQN
jgi:WD40 repeat protein/serine/threonine protein kinase